MSASQHGHSHAHDSSCVLGHTNTHPAMESALALLRNFGIDPSTLDLPKLERLEQLGRGITRPEDITPQVAAEIRDIIGVQVNETKKVPKKVTNKIRVNDKCPCQSGSKYKKCCGKNRPVTSSG